MKKAPLEINKYRLLFTAWWVLWFLMQAFVLIWLGFSFSVSLTDSVVTNLVLAASCLLVSNNLQYYLPQKDRHWYILALSVVMSGLWLAASRWLLISMIDDKDGYYLFLARSLPFRFGIAFLLIACMMIISAVWYTFED